MCQTHNKAQEVFQNEQLRKGTESNCRPPWLPLWLRSKESICSAGEAGDTGLIPESRRSSGGGHRNPLQCSCLENPMDRGAWWATVRHDWSDWALTHAVHFSVLVVCHILKHRLSLGVKEMHFIIIFIYHIAMTSTPWWPGRLGCPFLHKTWHRKNYSCFLKKWMCNSQMNDEFLEYKTMSRLFCFTFLCLSYVLPPSFYYFM